MTDSKSGDKKRKVVTGGKTKFRPQVTESSKRYLLRQAKDPFVKLAKKMGYNSRAAFKLKILNDKYSFIKGGMTVVDLGAAPGGWCQVAKELFGKKGGRIIAIDKIWMPPIEEVDFIKGDFTEDAVYEDLMKRCEGNPVNVVLSDMAPETSGHTGTDHLRIMALVEMAVDFSFQTLSPGGTFLCKIFQGGEEAKFRDEMRKYFTKVTFEKPDASRKDSKEIFILCQGYKGQAHYKEVNGL